MTQTSCRMPRPQWGVLTIFCRFFLNTHTQILLIKHRCTLHMQLGSQNLRSLVVAGLATNDGW